MGDLKHTNALEAIPNQIQSRFHPNPFYKTALTSLTEYIEDFVLWAHSLPN